MKNQAPSVGFFYRPGVKKAKLWSEKVEKWLVRNYPKIKINNKNPRILIVLGGDGTILEASKKYQRSTILGLNLGHVGFLASIRNEKNFLPHLKKFFKGDYRLTKKMMLSAEVVRNKKIVFSTSALNDVAIINPINMVDLAIKVEGHEFQYIHGTGALVSTATGSTAFNLSAHGPLIMPDIKCFILTELWDHSIPTPSLIVKRNREIEIKVADFRERGLISITKTNQPVDILLISDGETIFPLKKNDLIKIRRSPRLIKFVEIEKNYFLKSLKEKFAFR